jgi:hypothetical protein
MKFTTLTNQDIISYNMTRKARTGYRIKTSTTMIIEICDR